VADFLESVRTYVLSGNFFRGALITLGLTILAQSIGIVLGLIVALARTSRWRGLRRIAGLYIWFLRGTPVLLQLIFVYAALPQFGIRFSAFQSAVVALSLNEGAYMAEIIRSGIQSVSAGQRLASRALGMKEWQVMRYVVLPQATRVIIPPTGNQFIGMLKTSALASVISVQELLLTAQRTASANFDYVPALASAAIYYLALTTIFTFLQERLERRLSIEYRRRSRTTRTAVVPASGAATP
jgi:polar amino acid transport system permease protein